MKTRTATSSNQWWRCRGRTSTATVPDGVWNLLGHRFFVMRGVLVVLVEKREHELEHALIDAAALVNPELALERVSGTTALAMVRWPPALPMSLNQRRTKSPALRE